MRLRISPYPIAIFFLLPSFLFAQFRPETVNWAEDGRSFLHLVNSNVIETHLPSGKEEALVTSQQLTPTGANDPLKFNIYSFSNDSSKLLVFTNTAKVWRYNTRGDYWVFDLSSGKLVQLGRGLPSQSLMYAKLSPDGKKTAYVSLHNIYVEDLSSHKITQLTADGTRKLINGTFDWVYEEEFSCRDGFRWSPDSKRIAFWQIDGTKIRDYYMLNTTDSQYSRIIPVEYPKAGESPSPALIGVISIIDENIVWMKIPGDNQEHYIPRMEWADNSRELIVQQLNRKQNESKLFYCNASTGSANNFYSETDKAFIDVKPRWNNNDPVGWDWLDGGKKFLWVSEKDGWRHIYSVSRDGNKGILVTKGAYDIASIECIDDENGYVYFMASPENATQLYLFRTKLNGKGSLESLSPPGMRGTHTYNISPHAEFALHQFSNHKTLPAFEWISLPDHEPLNPEEGIARKMIVNENSNIEFFKVTTSDSITLDAWMIKPANFDSTKKYPVLFYVYGEPGSSTIEDKYGEQKNILFNGELSIEGYFQVSVDNRGTPSLRGADWRKSIYGKIGTLNIHDQAMAAKKILDRPYFDKDRVAVWGWSGGGSTTLHLLFQYPEIYKTGISIAAVNNLLFYDNIYEERYMGLPSENMENYIKGSTITYAKNLEGNLLFVHGTADDNVHYDNAEVLLNELIKYNKKFQFMPYPNRNHSINSGAGTSKHLSTLYSDFLRKNCPPGPREVRTLNAVERKGETILTK